MTDDPNHDDTLDSLDELERNLRTQAQAEFDADPLGTAIGGMRDNLNDLEEYETNEGFVRGYRYAIHGAVQHYLVYSGVYSCQCDRFWPEAKKGDPTPYWECANCGEFVAYEGEEIPEPSTEEA